MSEKGSKIRAFLVDDEPLALRRLESMLLETGRVEVTGSTTDPEKALIEIRENASDVLFLDIKMPRLSGFELLEKLETHPPVIFTTAFSEHSLDAFEYFSIDYLLKPVEKKRLDAALDKFKRFAIPKTKRFDEFIEHIRKDEPNVGPIKRISSRVGSTVRIIKINEISHFYAEDKITFAVMLTGESRPIDLSLNELEKDLDSERFMRIHRSTIVNLDRIKELHGWFAGGVMVRLKDAANTELTVARSRVKRLKAVLGM